MTSEGQTPRAPAPEIGLFEQDLRDELRRGRVVVVVGAGVSVATTGGEAVASWAGLLENGVSRCEQVFLSLPDDWGDGLRARIRSGQVDNLISVAEEVTSTLGGPDSGEYRRWLRETAGRLEPYDPAVIEALHDLGIPIITTNYDSLIERVTGLEPVTWRGGPRIERLLRGDEPGSCTSTASGRIPSRSSSASTPTRRSSGTPTRSSSRAPSRRSTRCSSSAVAKV